MMYVPTNSRDSVLLAMPPAPSPVRRRGPATARSGRHCQRCRPNGMGDANTTAQYTQAFGTVAAPAVAAATGSTAAGILGISTAAAIPIVGAAIVGVSIAAALLIKNSGCGQTCIETSQWANQAEPLLAQNIQAYFSNPTPRSQSQQNAALANFDAVWARLTQMCSDPSTGNAGKRCISDRQSGACTWHQRADSPLLAYPGQPQAGECWNWFSGYRDPIANDPNVAPDSVSSLATSALTAAETLPSWVWLVALAVLAVSL